ncbi:MAG: hypothetical protein WBC44_04245 [Planctomycetaceae bacterium]
MKTFAKALLVAGAGVFGTFINIVEAATPWQESAYSRGIAAGGCYDTDRWHGTRGYNDGYRSYDNYADSRWNDSHYNDAYQTPSRFDRRHDDSYVSWSHGDGYASRQQRPAYDDWRHDSSRRDPHLSWSNHDRYDDHSRLFEPWRPANTWEDGRSYYSADRDSFGRSGLRF